MPGQHGPTLKLGQPNGSPTPATFDERLQLMGCWHGVCTEGYLLRRPFHCAMSKIAADELVAWGLY